MSYWDSVRRVVPAVGLVIGLAGSALAGEWADITPKRTSDFDANKATGYCVIRVRVDIETIVHVRGDKVAFETMGGQRSTDEGTECSQALPSGNGLANFRFSGVDGRGDQAVLEAPSASNNWTAKIRIRDSSGGSEGYTGRMEWDNRGGSNPQNNTGWGGATGGTGAGGWGTNPSASGTGGGARGGRGGGSEFSGTVAGNGRFEVRNGAAADLTEARVNLMRNGQFRLELRGNNANYDLSGRWIRRGANAVLEITQGLGNAGATGRGTVEFQGDQLARVSVNGTNTGANTEFRANFRSGSATNTGMAANPGPNSGWGTDARSNSGWGAAGANSGWGNTTNVRAFSGTSTGSGSFSGPGGRQTTLSEARLEIRANGEAQLDFRGQSTPSFFGRVENQTNTDATIRLSKFGQANAEGTIRVRMSGGRIESAEGQGKSGNGRDFSVNFRR